MDIRTLIAGIIVSLLVGAGMGYTLAPKSMSSPELENQIEEYQSSIQTLENENSDLQTSLSYAMNSNAELQTTLTSVEGENDELEQVIVTTQYALKNIETQLSALQCGFGSPVYDSGWTPIEQNEIVSLEHGLETIEDLFVYLIGRYPDGDSHQLHQLYYGLGYWQDYDDGCGWSMDDTYVYVERGEIDYSWEEFRVYIWQIQGGSSGSAYGSYLPEIKYEEIVVSGEETYEYSKIIDLEGYKDVTISWFNDMDDGIIGFSWDRELSDGSYFRVGPPFMVDNLNGRFFGSDEYGWYRPWRGSESIKVGGKYLEVWTWHGSDYWDQLDELNILIYATK